MQMVNESANSWKYKKWNFYKEIDELFFVYRKDMKNLLISHDISF